MPPKKQPKWNPPKTKKERQQLYRKCGPTVFLDPSNLTYPVVPKNNGCNKTRIGEIAALKRANMQHRFDLIPKGQLLLRDQK